MATYARAMEEQAVADLVERARAGDQSAWSALVSRFAPLVYSVAYRHGLDHATAADVSQTTWLRLAEHLDRIRQPERLAGWLSTTARNESIRIAGRRRRELPTDLQDNRPSAADDPGDQVANDERDRLLAHVVSQLSQQCQLLLRLLFAGLSYPEISATMNIPHGSIGPNRARCLAKARQIMGDSHA